MSPRDFLQRSMRRNLAIVASHHHRSGGCMKSLGVRLMLLAVFVVASGIAAYFVWTSESHVRGSADDVRAFDQSALDAERGVLELRSAQQAYVAAGQDARVWITKAAETTTNV